MSEPTGAQALAERMLQLFQQESRAGLDLIAALLDGGRSDPAGIDSVFRAFHTLRGSAAMNGLDEIAGLALVFEHRFERLRREPQALDADTLALTTEGGHLLRRLLDSQGAAGVELAAQIAALRERLSVAACAEPPAAAQQPERQPAESAQRLFHLIFEPGEQLMRRGVDMLALLDELDWLGERVLVPALDRLPRLDAMRPDSVYLSWQMLLRTEASAEEVQDLFMFVAADSRVAVQELALAGPLAGDWARRARALLLRRSWLPSGTLARELCGSIAVCHG